MIPQNKLEAVARGLQETFGVSAFEDIRKMAQGSSALAYRIVVNGSPFLLKFITRGGDPVAARQIACMRTAAEAGLAPKVWYANAADRIVITDFVDAVPFPASEARLRMPAILRSLHALPSFETIPDGVNTSCMFLLNQGPGLDGLIKAFRASKLLSETETDELFGWHAKIVAAYPRCEADMVSSHNDLFKPDNILFDGKRVWLVDWEAAFRNDRYADLAVLANMLVTDEAEESAYLKAYFGAPPDPYQRARFFLMQQIAHMFYTVAFLMAGAVGEKPDFSDAPPDYREFQRRMWTGEVELLDKPTKMAYARAHHAQLRHNLQGERFRESLEILSGPPVSASAEK